jgi:dTDP-4-dehydrorhamnose 3,5-epimerase-like enzyme
MVILEPRVFEDERGYFLESYNESEMAEAAIRQRFVQDNHSYSVRNVVRGLPTSYVTLRASLYELWRVKFCTSPWI